ncbi:MAG: phosphosulfolactate synthase [Candidatus Freyarchaeota archaeon]|nr:phosphosulfolactate synthase [Candidatus Jordarchaeia archaeon]
MERELKPRSSGLTMVIDRGITLSEMRGLMEVAGEYVDLWKFGWCTWLLMPLKVVREKIRVCEEFDVKVMPGGSSVEAAFARGKVREFFVFLREAGFTSLEVSSGIVNMNLEEKIELVHLAKDFGFHPVITEVGRKKPEEDASISLSDRVELMKHELKAGADYVVVEARESGVGIGPYDAKGDVKRDFVEAIIKEIPATSTMWEAPLKSQQVWLIRRFGSNVNLGNIPPDDVIPLETLRLGLRGDTMPDLLLKVSR